MYKVSYELCSSLRNAKLEPTIICNYATFIYKQRKDIDNAKRLFMEGIRTFPSHKGLQKNFGVFLKLNRDIFLEKDAYILTEFEYLVK